MPQPIVYVEIGATDVARAADFFISVFQWDFTDRTQVAYSTFTTGDGIGGGIYRTKEMKPTGGVVLYIMVPDIDATLAQISMHGGRVVVPRSDIPGTGWYGHFQDPFGNLLGLFTPRG